MCLEATCLSVTHQRQYPSPTPESPSKPRRRPTLKVDEDEEVIVLQVVAPPQVKVFDEVAPSPGGAAVAAARWVQGAHLGRMVPPQLPVHRWGAEKMLAYVGVMGSWVRVHGEGQGGERG